MKNLMLYVISLKLTEQTNTIKCDTIIIEVLILRTASQKSNYVIYYDIKVLKAEI
jgi:hypothetical protein